MRYVVLGAAVTAVCLLVLLGLGAIYWSYREWGPIVPIGILAAGAIGFLVGSVEWWTDQPQSQPRTLTTREQAIQDARNREIEGP